MSDRLNSYSFNLFRGGIKVKQPSGIITLAEAVALISGPAYQIPTEGLRSSSPDIRKTLKAQFDYVTFSGSFQPTRLVKNLRQHSGLICLDFDHVENLFETRLQLQADPHTLVLFTSPSGDGLKVIFEIDQLNVETGNSWEQRHKDAFVDIAFYVRQTYGLDIDASGSDVSRACFLPHDAQTFVNLEADPYAIKGLATRKTPKPRTEAQQVQDANDVYRHVLAVVERIEAAQVDISGGSGEYDQRLLLAFCMSTLGEDGRDLLHRILQFYPNYTQQETDDKFDQGVNTSRFTTPWKFFDMAKQHGIDVSRPGRPKKDKTTKNVVSENADAQSLLRKVKPNYEQWETNGTVTYDKDEYAIRIKSGKSGFNTVADNFLLYIKYLTEDENECLTWILQILPGEGDPIYVEVPHDDFNSASRLKKLVSGKQFALKISDTELSELHAFLFARTRFSKAVKIIRYGYHAPSGVFFFANKALTATGQVLEPDEFGMIGIDQPDGKQLHLSMPANNKHKEIVHADRL